MRKYKKVTIDAESLKVIVMDIKAGTDKSQHIDIEMQTYGLAEYPDRALFNGARMIGTSLEKEGNMAE